MPTLGRSRRVTLDGQLLGYWEREAARLDSLASATRFAWQRRRFQRKAEVARAKAATSREREAARGNEPGPVET